MMRSIAPFPSAWSNLRLAEAILYDLPPLEGVFFHWHTYGRTATTAGMASLLARRQQLLGSTTLSAASIQLLAACATDCLSSFPHQGPYSPWDSRPLHARLLRHGPRLRAVDTQALLPPGVLVQQTVSLSMADASLLCASVGPQMLTRRQLRAIAATLALPRWAVKRRSITPSTCRSDENCASEPALISPFLPPARDASIDALVILPWPQRWEAQEREVAIALSLWESLLMPVRCLRHLLRIYAQLASPAVLVVELASESTSAGHADKDPCSCMPLIAMGDRPQATGQPAEDALLLVQDLISLLSTGFTAVREGKQMQHAWCESPCPGWLAQAGCHLDARVHSDGPLSRCSFIDMACVALHACSCPSTGFLQGEVR